MTELEIAEKQLENYLEKHPNLLKYQRSLNISLNKAGNDPMKRIEVICFYLQDNLNQLRIELELLLRKINGSIENQK